MELLMAVAILGVIAALAIPSLAGVMDGGRQVKANRQAQAVAQTYAAARAAGAEFAVLTREGVVDTLTQMGGVHGRGIFSDTAFTLPLSPAERLEVRGSAALVGRVMEDGSFQLEFHPLGRP